MFTPIENEGTPSDNTPSTENDKWQLSLAGCHEYNRAYFSRFPQFGSDCRMDCCLFFSLFLFFVTQNIRMNARKERILPPDEIEDLHDDDSDFLKCFEIKSKINFFFPDSFNILTINNKNIIKTK